MVELLRSIKMHDSYLANNFLLLYTILHFSFITSRSLFLFILFFLNVGLRALYSIPSFLDNKIVLSRILHYSTTLFFLQFTPSSFALHFECKYVEVFNYLILRFTIFFQLIIKTWTEFGFKGNSSKMLCYKRLTLRLKSRTPNRTFWISYFYLKIVKKVLGSKKNIFEKLW